jgi:hypothetical protein
LYPDLDYPIGDTVSSDTAATYNFGIGAFLIPSGTNVYQGHFYNISSTSTILAINANNTGGQTLAVGMWDAFGYEVSQWTGTADGLSYTQLVLPAAAWVKNSGGNTVTTAYIGKPCYLENGELVGFSATPLGGSAYAPIAGIVLGVDSVLGVLVDFTRRS